MKCDECLEKGYSIGSGIVESTCGHTVKKKGLCHLCRSIMLGIAGNSLYIKDPCIVRAGEICDNAFALVIGPVVCPL